MGDLEERRARCTRFPLGNGNVRPSDLIATIGDDVEPDLYGSGGVVDELETYVAGLLGTEAAVFVPSGTMAQAATLRVHADSRSRRTVLWHPSCHLATHEGEGYARLHGLVGRPVGHVDRLVEPADLEGVAEPVAALLLELPQRDLGGRLPDWDSLVEQVEWARAHGTAAHLDGARLWEASAGYDRTPAAIAGLFDTTYVSFYKGIGALPGCCVAGRSQIVGQVREWRRRMGGTLWALWPAAASALSLLPSRLAEMPARMTHARDIAVALTGVSGVDVLPDPPQTPMMHLAFHVTAERFADNARRLADEHQVWVWPQAMPTGLASVVRAELTVGSGTLRFSAEELAGILGSLAE